MSATRELSGMVRRLRHAAGNIGSALATEAARLNRVGLRGSPTVGANAQLPRRTRARMVIAALARGHDGRNHCC